MNAYYHVRCLSSVQCHSSISTCARNLFAQPVFRSSQPFYKISPCYAPFRMGDRSSTHRPRNSSLPHIAVLFVLRLHAAAASGMLLLLCACGLPMTA
jgi:hypothetical protein